MELNFGWCPRGLDILGYRASSLSGISRVLTNYLTVCGAELRLVMTVVERGGSVTQGWSVDLGGLSVIRRRNRAGTWSESVTVSPSGGGVSCFSKKEIVKNCTLS